jgi:hypothetical protein
MTDIVLTIVLVAVYFGWRAWRMEKKFDKFASEIMQGINSVESRVGILASHALEQEGKEKAKEDRKRLGLPSSATDEEVQEAEEKLFREYERQRENSPPFVDE